MTKHDQQGFDVYIPGVPAGLLFLLLLLPFSKQEKGSEQGTEEDELLPNIGEVQQSMKMRSDISVIKEGDDIGEEVGGGERERLGKKGS